MRTPICSVIFSFEDLPIEIPEPSSGHGGDGAELRLLVLCGHEGLGRPSKAGGHPLRPALWSKFPRWQQARQSRRFRSRQSGKPRSEANHVNPLPVKPCCHRLAKRIRSVAVALDARPDLAHAGEVPDQVQPEEALQQELESSSRSRVSQWKPEQFSAWRRG